MIQGIDTSDIQGNINVPAVKAFGIEFIVAQATIGNETSRNSKTFHEVARQCRSEDVVCIPYHFAFPLRARNSPREAARRQVDYVNGASDYPHALDLEWPYPNAWSHWSVNAGFVSDWGLTWLDEIETLTARAGFLYTFPAFWASLGAEGKKPEWSKYPLWIAAPGQPKPPVVAPWASWTIHQTSHHGMVPGIRTPVDLDVFNGSRDDLLSYRGTSATHFDFLTPHELQVALLTKGFSPGVLDGKVGPQTIAAVKAFQGFAGLVPDGIVGPKTTAALLANVPWKTG